MRAYLLFILLFLQINLLAQPTLTLDYFFQDGLHEYNWVSVDSSKLAKNGENVVWDFSHGAIIEPAASYKLDTISTFLKYYHPNLSHVDRRLSEIISCQVKYRYLDFDQPINSVAYGFIDCDLLAPVSRIYNNPAIVFPIDLDYYSQVIDTIIYETYLRHADTLKLDTIQNIKTFTYAAFGQFIHPNKDTFCDVIKITTLEETHFDNIYEASIWYSIEAKGVLAEEENYYSGDLEEGLKRVRVKNMDVVNISDNIFSEDTIIINHSLQECGIRLSVFSDNICTESKEYDFALIDYFNDNVFEDTSFLITSTTHQPSFEIGIHRILYKKSLSNSQLEKIVIINDKRKPQIRGYGDGGGFYLEMPQDSSSILLTPDDISFGTIDNNCRDTFVFRIWLNPMEDNIPNPTALSKGQILTNLPANYRINCFEENEKTFWGWLFAFDQSGNWSGRSFYIRVKANNCTYYCPTTTFTKLSFKDINGNSLNQIIAPAYRKEMEIQDSLYLYRVCDTDSTNARLGFHKTGSVIENVSSFDLLLIQKHILGIKPFTSFYQFAAADVNYSGDITAFDLLMIKRTILGFNYRFNGGKSWVFFEQEENLLDKHPYLDVFPLHLLEEKRYSLTDTTYHFLSIKLGDVSSNNL